MKKTKARHIRSAIVIIIVLILLSAVFIIFRNILNSKLRDNEEQHLIESANTVSEVFYTKLDDQLTMLESQARYFQSIDLTDYTTLK